MNFFQKLFTKKKKTTKEIQAELKALCMKLTAQGTYSIVDMGRYEDLLAELYNRGVEPEYWLKKLIQKE